MPANATPNVQNGRTTVHSDRKSKKMSDSRDTKTIKIFISISLLFVLSFLPSVLILLGFVSDFAVLFYAYFINHFGNPIVYFIIDKQFRDQLKKDIEMLCNCLSKT